MSLVKASIWTAGSTFIKIVIGFIIIKLLSITFGPSGVGLACNLRQLLTVFGVLSGGGIFNGVTKYVSEYRDDQIKLRNVLGTASLIVLIFSILITIIFLLTSNFVSIFLFGNKNYSLVVSVIAFIQIGIAYSNYFLSIIKGYSDASGNAQAVIIGNLLGIIIYFLCYKFYGYKGSLIGLAFIQALVVLPAILIIFRKRQFKISLLKPFWDKKTALDLFKFTIMTILTSITIPVAYILMRKLLAKYYGWDEAGLWSAINMISDVYLQFITASFSVYLLSTFSRLKCKNQISTEVIKTLKFVIPIVIIISFIVWLLRDFIVLLLFSQKFIKIKDLFILQIVGDILKTSSYVFGYLIIAKASLFFYFVTELTQFILLISFSYFFIPLYGLLGVVQSYMLTYIIYFIFCCFIFFIYYKKYD